ncbi:protein yellow-like [Planococcus citri]|uniref:protein yellow-like n=1 Tax=Planococcus citri TaxID=170843 RepID=UPI0031F78C42
MKSLMGHSLAWPADYNWYPVTEISNFPRQHVTNVSVFYPWFLSMWSMATASTSTTPPPSSLTIHSAENTDTTPRRFQTMAKPGPTNRWIADSEDSPTRQRTRPLASSFPSTFEEVVSWKQIDIEYPTKKARDAAIKSGRFVAENNLPLGLHVFRSKIFVTLPKWKEGVPVTLGFVGRGQGRSPAIKPYPDWSWHGQSCDGLTSVFRIDVDVCNRLWVLDSGVVDAENTVRQMCPPQIFIFDLETDKLLHRYTLPRDQSPDSSLLSNIVVEVLPNTHNNNDGDGGRHYRDTDTDTDSHSHGHSHSHTRSHTRSYSTNSDSDSTSNFNHLPPRPAKSQHQRYNANRVNGYDCVDAYAYLGDVFRYGLIVYSYKTNRSWRVTHSYFYPDPLASDYVLDGIEFQWVDGLFGMALSPLDSRAQRLLYFHPLSSYREFAVPTHVLRNETLGFAMTKFFRIVGKPRGESVSHSTGSGMSNNGILFYNLLTKAAVACWNSDLPYDPSTQHVLYQDNVTMSFPNDLRVDLEPEQSVWVLSNRLHRFLYDRLDPNDVNFRILSAPVNGVVRGTVCDQGAVYPGDEYKSQESSSRYRDPW